MCFSCIISLCKKIKTDKNRIFFTKIVSLCFEKIEKMAQIVLFSFFIAVFVLFFGKFLKGRLWSLLALVPASIFVYFLNFIPQIEKGTKVLHLFPWFPSMGVHLNFLLDGLSFIFALMISGIGTLVFIYTASYLKGHLYLNRFYAYLLLFMGAMLGVVLSENLLTLFVFWEITSITSFFLIGFNNEDEASRKSALRALIITGIGGLLLLVGVIIIYQVTESYSMVELFSKREILQKNAYYLPVIWLIFMASFTKSAQFPFHFWLPGAMKAPTPVSTYLHSATMVKAGIYLLLRFTPILGENPLWNTPLVIVGGVTMVYAAFHTIFRIDLKAILAYTTISALGILVFLIGIGTEKALLAAVVFIVIHALYKATLFLVTGIIDHETKTRNVTQLSGLGKVLLPIAIIALFASLSHGGVPPTFGFVGKDLIYEAVFSHPNSLILFAISLITNVLLLYAGFVVGIKPFLGKLPEKYAKLHMPDVFMWLPPAILSVLCVVFGFFPNVLENFIASAVNYLGVTTAFHLKLWHGFNAILLYSAVTLFIGTVLYFVLSPSEEKLNFVKKLEIISPKTISQKIADGVLKISEISVHVLQNGYLTVYVKNTILVATVLLGISMFGKFSFNIDINSLSEITFYEVVVMGILILAVGFATFTNSRFAAVASLGLLSFAICMIYVMYSAPDLAMTQFSIDTLTTVLFVLMLYKLPNYLKIHTQKIKILDGILALSFGVVITLICLETLTTSQNTEISSFYAQNSYLLAHGKNVVNVILVDFRGADTMMEISVLSIAAIGVFGLIKLRLKTKERFKA